MIIELNGKGIEMKINTVIHGEMYGTTWEGFVGSLPFTVKRNNKIDLKQQLLDVVTGDFQKETVKLSGGVFITVTKRMGHSYQKRIDLADLPSLCEIV